MKKIYLSILFPILLTACGDSRDYFYTSGTIGDIQGDWITNCQTQSDGSSNITSYTFDTSRAGNDFFISGFSTYNTSNCSGPSDITILAGDVFYEGEQATALCLAEKVDLFVTSADDGFINYEGSQLDDFLDDSGLSNSSFDIACAPTNNRLFLGLNNATLDGTSDATRPTEMDTSVVYYRTNLSSRAAKAVSEQGSTIETAKARMKSTLRNATVE